jgi:hypothetical protein
MGVQRHAPAALPPGNIPVPIVHELVLAPGPVWTCVKKKYLPPLGFEPQTLQRVKSYPGRFEVLMDFIVCWGLCVELERELS